MFEAIIDFFWVQQYSSLFWVSAITGVFLVGMAKSGFGGGVGAIATPLVAITIPVAEAAALLLPILIVADFFSSRHYYREADWGLLRMLLPIAILGIAIGGLFFHQFSENERVLKVGIGLIAVLFVLYQLIAPFLFKNAGQREPENWFGRLMAGVAGFTSTLAHVGGPPIAIYLLLKHIPRQVYVGTMVIFFAIVNLVKLIPYTWLGLIRVGNLSTTLILLPVVVLGVQTGAWLNGRMSEQLFNRIVYALLFVTGVQLIIGRSLLGMLWG